MMRVLRTIHGSVSRSQPIRLLLAQVAGTVGLYLECPDETAEALTGQLYGEYPELELCPVSATDIELGLGERVWARTLVLRPDLFPLRLFTEQEDGKREFSDPLTNLLEAMGGDGELRSQLEFSITPVGSRALSVRWRRRAILTLSRPYFRFHAERSRRFADWVTGSWHLRIMAVIWAFAYSRGQSAVASPDLMTSSSRTHERESELTAAADKLGSSLYATSIRVLVTGPPSAKRQARRKLDQLVAAVKATAQTRVASFRVAGERSAMGTLPRRSRRRSLLSDADLASLYHPPTEGMAAACLLTSPARQPEPPLNLPTGLDRAAILLGHILYRGRELPAHLSIESARRHHHVIGTTGSGKSIYLLNQMRQLIHAGSGLALLDPNADLVRDALRLVPRRRWNDVVLFDPTDEFSPLSFNPLDCPDPKQRERRAAGILAAFQELFAVEAASTPRLLYILRNAIFVTLANERTTLLDIVRMLRDDAFRHQLVSRVDDPLVRDFWQVEFAGWSDRYRQEALPAIQNKLGNLLAYKRVRNVLCQPQSRLDLRNVMDERKILLCNLSIGELGREVSRLLGKLLIASVQSAAMSRAELVAEKRLDFSLFIDEVPEYDCPALTEMLEQVRKNNVGLTLAHQHLGHLKPETRMTLLANAGTRTVFSISFDDAEILARHHGTIRPDDIVHLPKFHAYLTMLIDAKTSSPMLLKTLPPPDSLLKPENLFRLYRKCRGPRRVVAAQSLPHGA